MGKYFICDDNGEYFIIQQDSPHNVAKVILFTHQQQIDSFIKKYYLENCSLQIKKYFALVVYANVLSNIHQADFLYSFKNLPPDKMKFLVKVSQLFRTKILIKKAEIFDSIKTVKR